MIAWTSDAMRAHAPGPRHVERPARLDAARAGLQGLVRWRQALAAPVDALLGVHAAPYVDQILGARGLHLQLDPDTVLSAGSVEAARCAAGAAIAMVDGLLRGEDAAGWAVVRPPGHHAERARAMGFCVFNNVAVAVQHAVAVHGVERVLVVDWDVHHGNGTQHLFEDRDDVMFYSSHRYGRGFYPGTGARTETGRGRGEGFTINAPLPAGAGDRELVEALRDCLEPRCRDWRPQLVLVSAGYDAHREDPIGGLAATERGFAKLALRVADLADGAGAPLGLVLEGGYALDALTRSIAATAHALDAGAAG